MYWRPRPNCNSVDNFMNVEILLYDRQSLLASHVVNPLYSKALDPKN
jgi:hypothetical protein